MLIEQLDLDRASSRAKRRPKASLQPALDGDRASIPSSEEGEIARDKLGIFKRVTYSDEVLAAKKAAMAPLRLSKNLDGKPVGKNQEWGGATPSLCLPVGASTEAEAAARPC